MKLLENDKIYIKKMKYFTEIYNNVIINIILLISDDIIKTENKLKKYMEYNKDFEKLISNIYSIYMKGDYYNFSKIMKDLLYDLMNQKILINRFLKILILTTNKYFKNEITHEQFQKKMYNINKEKIYNMTALKYVNWLFNPQ